MNALRMTPPPSVLVCAAFAVALALPGCGDSSEGVPLSAPAARRPTVATVNYPLAYLAARIGGDQVDAFYPGPGDTDPAFWFPDDESIAAYQSAHLILLNGAGYAGWRDKVSLPTSRLVDTSRAFTDQLITVDAGVTHSHGPDGDHSHGVTAFTTWLDPTLAEAHARAIAEAFAARWPDHRGAFEQRLEQLVSDLQALDAQLAEITSVAGDHPLVGSHPVYQYLARRYDLALRSVHWEPDVAPDSAAWDELSRLLEQHPARWMLWEAEPLTDTREKLRVRDIGCVVFQPGATAPETGDYLDLMRTNVEALRAAFR